MHVAWPSCACLLLSFFPFPVGHSAAAPTKLNFISGFHCTKEVWTMNGFRFPHPVLSSFLPPFISRLSLRHPSHSQPRPDALFARRRACPNSHDSQINLDTYLRARYTYTHFGASINDVRKHFRLLDPLPPCPQIHATSLTKVAYYVCFWRYPPPPQCGCHKW